MTSQQFTLVLMAGAGVGLFVAGRIVARKLVPEKKPSFMQPTVISPRAVVALLTELLSWGSIALAAACLLMVVD